MKKEMVGGDYATDADSIITGYNRMRTGLILMLMRYGEQTFTRDEALAIMKESTRYPIYLNMGETNLQMKIEPLLNAQHSRTQ